LLRIKLEIGEGVPEMMILSSRTCFEGERERKSSKKVSLKLRVGLENSESKGWNSAVSMLILALFRVAGSLN